MPPAASTIDTVGHAYVILEVKCTPALLRGGDVVVDVAVQMLVTLLDAAIISAPSSVAMNKVGTFFGSTQYVFHVQ
jgi:hypothetical protein